MIVYCSNDFHPTKPLALNFKSKVSEKFFNPQNYLKKILANSLISSFSTAQSMWIVDKSRSVMQIFAFNGRLDSSYRIMPSELRKRK